MKDHIRSSLREARTALDRLLANDETLAKIERTAVAFIETFRARGRVYACGNGGSMSDAMHFAEELTARYRKGSRRASGDRDQRSGAYHLRRKRLRLRGRLLAVPRKPRAGG